MLGEQIDRLVDEIERVKSQINNSGASLRSSEKRTGRILIDPMLQALGWDTGDGLLVISEYNIDGERVDYALIGADQQPVAIVEAKKLDEPLSRHREQVARYAKKTRRGFSVLTNGNEWEVYDNSKPGRFEQRRILMVSIAEHSSLACAVPLLQLWRPYLVPDQPAPSVVPVSDPRPTSPETAAPIQPRPPAPGAGWKSLRDLRIAEKHARLPPKMRLPNGEERKIERWNDILFEVAEWLIRDGKLTAAKCPIPLGRSDRNCLVNSRPKHTNGRDLRSPRELTKGLFLNVDMAPTKLVGRSRELMEHLGRDPATVHVQAG